MNDHDFGLDHDLPRRLGRRRVLHLIGAAGAAVLVGCVDDDDAATETTSQQTTASSSPSSSTSSSTSTSGSTAPTTAAGPTPVFGSGALISITGRKLLRHGRPLLLKCMSSWGMTQRLSNADITYFLEEIVDLGYNSFAVSPCGLSFGSGAGWVRYSNQGGQPYFATTQGGTWPSPPITGQLGAAWSTVDHMMSEAARLDLVVLFTFYAGYADEGIASAMISAGLTNCYDYGTRVATRYTDYDNFVWHYVADWDYDYSERESTHADALFHGITDVDGTDRLILCEPRRPRTSYDQFISQEGPSGYQWLHVDLNSLYDHDGPGTEEIDGVYNETGATDLPVWNCEPAYIESSHYSGDDQELREAFYSTFIRGGVGLNVGSEEIYSFNAAGVQIASPDWEAGLTNVELLRTEHLWTLMDRYVTDLTWVPSSWVTTGVGTGDTKAAAGNSDSAALCYFPTSRTIVVDTTVLSGTAPVRLRWFDPTDGTYTVIATSEAQNAARSVTHPGASSNSAGVGDWVLVVDGV